MVIECAQRDGKSPHVTQHLHVFIPVIKTKKIDEMFTVFCFIWPYATALTGEKIVPDIASWQTMMDEAHSQTEHFSKLIESMTNELISTGDQLKVRTRLSPNQSNALID